MTGSAANLLVSCSSSMKVAKNQHTKTTTAFNKKLQNISEWALHLLFPWHGILQIALDAESEMKRHSLAFKFPVVLRGAEKILTHVSWNKQVMNKNSDILKRKTVVESTSFSLFSINFKKLDLSKRRINGK